MCNEVIDEVLDHLVIHDKRPAVQQTSLACLLKFAQRVPHAWTNEQSNYLLKWVAVTLLLKLLTDLPFCVQQVIAFKEFVIWSPLIELIAITCLTAPEQSL